MELLILVLLPVDSLYEPGLPPGEIIRGQEAQPYSRPYMAYLEIQCKGKTYICGGFLVSENFVLTAAHCKGDKIIEQSQHKNSVRHWIPHPQFSRATRNNDIMLLQLEERVKLNRWVDSIALPHASERVKPGAVCSIAAMLQEVDVVVMQAAAFSIPPSLPAHPLPPSIHPDSGTNCCSISAPLVPSPLPCLLIYFTPCSLSAGINGV
uniref:Peptidase S1 domain-containing protein n=1 Tax=Gopherus agassizii TaxID=38772 RepID=A0A452IJG0_9SAUR